MQESKSEERVVDLSKVREMRKPENADLLLYDRLAQLGIMAPLLSVGGLQGVFTVGSAEAGSHPIETRMAMFDRLRLDIPEDMLRAAYVAHRMRKGDSLEAAIDLYKRAMFFLTLPHDVITAMRKMGVEP